MTLPAGWYPVAGDPAGTHRYWDGDEFTTSARRDANKKRAAQLVKPNSAAKWRMAGPVSRLIAALIDYGAPIVIVVGIGSSLGLGVSGPDAGKWVGETNVVLAVVGFIVLNQILLVGLLGVSMGRVLLGMKVVDTRDKDRPPGLIRATVRLLMLVPALPATAFFFLMGRRHGLHDLVAGTSVIYV